MQRTLEFDRTLTLTERFHAFDEANPHIADEIERIALQWIADGRTRGSVKRIVEDLRWSPEVETRGEQFKIDNSYSSFYARLIAERNPQLDGFFELRKLVSQETRTP